MLRFNQVLLALLLCLFPSIGFAQCEYIENVKCAPGVKCGILASLNKARKDIGLLPSVKHENGRTIRPSEYKSLTDKRFCLPRNAKPNLARTRALLKTAVSLSTTRPVTRAARTPNTAVKPVPASTVSQKDFEQFKSAIVSSVTQAIQPVIAQNNSLRQQLDQERQTSRGRVDWWWLLIVIVFAAAAVIFLYRRGRGDELILGDAERYRRERNQFESEASLLRQELKELKARWADPAAVRAQYEHLQAETTRRTSPAG